VSKSRRMASRSRVINTSATALFHLCSGRRLPTADLVEEGMGIAGMIRFNAAPVESPRKNGVHGEAVREPARKPMKVHCGPRDRSESH